MNAPLPTEKHKLLQRLAGHWQGEETMFPPDTDQPVKVTSVVQSRMELGGWFLFMGYAQLQEGSPSYTAHGVMGLSHTQENITLHWFDSQGWNPSEPFRGNWQGETLQLNAHSDNGYDRLTYVMQGPDQYTTKVENSSDGKDWKTLIEGSYQRTQTAG